MVDKADDWQSGKGLADTNLAMLEGEIGSDITFIMGSKGERVRAHKFMLVSEQKVHQVIFLKKHTTIKLFIRYYHTNYINQSIYCIY